LKENEVPPFTIAVIERGDKDPVETELLPRCALPLCSCWKSAAKLRSEINLS
jgi:hypothetical protein